MKGSTNASARPNIRIQDASAEFVANTDTSTNAEFPYRASVSITGVTHYMSATVIYSQAQCISGAYATYCQTYDGGVYLYAKTNVGTQTIPAISCDISVNYINVENVPTSGSQSVITSGGVYANCVLLTENQTITGSKILINRLKSKDSSLSVNSTRASDEWSSTGLELYDNSNSRFCYLAPVFTTGKNVDLKFNLNDGVNDKTITFSSTGYVTIPYRTSGMTNYDVLTKGNLWSATSETQVNETSYSYTKYGRIVFMTVFYSNTSTGSFVVTTNAPKCKSTNVSVPSHDGNGTACGRVYLNYNTSTIVAVCNIANAQNITSFVYLTE